MFMYLRCDKQVLLYNECLEVERMHTTRKFRNGKVYAMNDQEKNIYNKLVLEKSKTEMEILNNRQKHFRNNTDTINKEITYKSIPEILKREFVSEW